MDSLIHLQSVTLNSRGMSRRSVLRGLTAGAVAAGSLTFPELMAARAADLRKEGMALILLWMQGGPSQMETFDPKPGTANGGPTTAIDTAVPGIQIANGWEQTAKMMGEIALIRSMNNKEGEHQRASYQMHTGYIPSGSVRYPSLGCAIAKEIAPADHPLPAVVSVGGSQVGSGFLGVDFEPFVVQNAGRLPNNVSMTTDDKRYNRRLGLLDRLEGEFASKGGEVVVGEHRQLYSKTARMVQSPDVKAFDLSAESDRTKAAYGSTNFGQGCLLARRLVEAGVTFVEVRDGNWDTHDDNFNRVKTRAGEVDPAYAALLADLKQRGMLERTLVVWMGEFGRSPRINPRTGRDHFPRAFNVALAGGGIKGGQVIGATTADGNAVKDNPVGVPQLFTSICQSLKVNPARENLSPLGRPIKIVDGGEPIPQLFS